MKRIFALARFELHCTIRQVEFVTCYLVLTGLSILMVHIMGGTFSTIQVVKDIPNVNSPDVIDIFANTILLAAVFIIAGITGNGAIRDYRYKSYELTLTFPLSWSQYIVGKFTGLYLACLLLFTAPLAGYASACSFPWIDRTLVLPFRISIYTAIYLQRYMLSVFFLSTVFFTSGLLTGNKAIIRILLVLWYGWYLFSYYCLDQAAMNLSILPDPLGIYINTGSTAYIYNRLLWSGTGVLLLICISWRPLYRKIRQSPVGRLRERNNLVH